MEDKRLMTELEAVAVDSRMLSTNFVDAVPDCLGVGVDPKTEIVNRHPLYNYLINTSLSRRVRAMINRDSGMCILHKDATTGKYVIEIPQTFWSLPAQDTSAECCWVPFDFAKCESNVPVNRLCLKDCQSIDDEVMGRILHMNATYGDIAYRGEMLNTTKKRVARLSMAFLTAYNAILGTDNNTTPILKPFHGLLQVMSNEAIGTVDGTDILSAFDAMYCRLSILGYDDVVFAMNPIIYSSVLSVVRAGQNGQLPLGWTRNGDSVSFHGMRFIQDKLVPVDLAGGTGDIWVLSGDAVGLWMATDLMPADAFIKESGHQEESLADGCGSECTFYYNYGAAFNNNANKLMKVVNVPISANCVNATGDLGNLIMPTTLIPKV